MLLKQKATMKGGMIMGWLLLALVIGILVGCILPVLWRRLVKQVPLGVSRKAEQASEQMLTEWLYGGEISD
jgi:hypothetical protein